MLQSNQVRVSFAALWLCTSLAASGLADEKEPTASDSRVSLLALEIEESEEEELAPTALFQPPTETQPPRRAAPESQFRRAATPTRRPPTRLASVPNMFGDFLGGGPVLTATFQDQSLGLKRQFAATLVPSGGGRHTKIGEQNKALPEDRVYFFYNHFENAQAASDVAGAVRQFPIDRYTFGFEKTFFDGIWSVELRMPLSNSFDFTGNPANPADFNIAGGSAGNLAIIPKCLLYESEVTAFSAGLGIELPTGSDMSGQAFGGAFQVSNDAVHFSPYLGVMHQSSERIFWLGFVQIDLATNGNRVSVTDAALGNADLGRFNEQNVGFLDLAGGYSFYEAPDARWLTRMAAQAEVHYAGTIQNPDRLENQRGLVSLSLAPVTRSANIVNLTFALTGTLGENTLVRVATSAPVTNQQNRFFDSEIQAAVIQRF